MKEKRLKEGKESMLKSCSMVEDLFLSTKTRQLIKSLMKNLGLILQV
jgi:hypothetical protein